MKVFQMRKKLVPRGIEAIAQTPQPRPSSRALGILSSWLMAAASRHRIRLAVHELAERDDRSLKDMGIHRSEIERAVRCGRTR